MKGFQYQDVGLFTFYREQAEYEENREKQKRERQLKKQLQIQQRERRRKQKANSMQKAKPHQLKLIAPSPTFESPREDPTEKAKKYLKQLQQNGHSKLLHSYRRKQRRYNNINSQAAQNDLTLSLSPLEKVDGQAVSSLEEIFMKKKDYSKWNYYMLFDKEPVAPKQFDSVEVFQMGIGAGLQDRQYSEDLIRRKPPRKDVDSIQKRIPNLLPQLYSSSRPPPPSIVPIYKREKDRKNSYYNPIDIILNNEKFKIKQISKSYKPSKADDHLNNEISNGGNGNGNGNNSVLAVIKKYRMIK